MRHRHRGRNLQRDKYRTTPATPAMAGRGAARQGPGTIHLHPPPASTALSIPRAGCLLNISASMSLPPSPSKLSARVSSLIRMAFTHGRVAAGRWKGSKRDSRNRRRRKAARRRAAASAPAPGRLYHLAAARQSPGRPAHAPRGERAAASLCWTLARRTVGTRTRTTLAHIRAREGGNIMSQQPSSSIASALIYHLATAWRVAADRRARAERSSYLAVADAAVGWREDASMCSGHPVLSACQTIFSPLHGMRSISL